MTVVTSLSFAGRTEEALEFYKDRLGAEIMFLMRFHESPDPSFTKPGREELIFHATFRIDGTELMASDADVLNGERSVLFSGFALALRLDSIERAEKIFNALSDGGNVVLPLAKSTFTAAYGIVKDRFGLTWKLVVSNEEQP